MRADVKKEFEWASQYNGKVMEIIRKLAGKIINVREGTPTEDMKQATDMVVEVNVGAIAVRVRRIKFNNPYDDVTIRSYSRGNKTEIHKIKEGWGSWYLYAWDRCNNWVFYDIDRLRDSGLLEDEIKQIPNGDGTRFHSISVKTLDKHEVIVDCSENIREYLDFN